MSDETKEDDWTEAMMMLDEAQERLGFTIMAGVLTHNSYDPIEPNTLYVSAGRIRHGGMVSEYRTTLTVSLQNAFDYLEWHEARWVRWTRDKSIPSDYFRVTWEGRLVGT